MIPTVTDQPTSWQEILRSPQRRLSIILWLVALHSFCVGVGLILLPDEWLSFFGFSAGGERFFRAQAGVFHFVMVVVYVMAAKRCATSLDATTLAVGAKILATIFLLSYYLFVQSIWMVLLSGIADGVLGALILWACLACRASVRVAGAGSGT